MQNTVMNRCKTVYHQFYVPDYTSPEYNDLFSISVAGRCTQYVQKRVYAGSEQIALASYGSCDYELLYVHEDERGSVSYYSKPNGGVYARQLYDDWGVPMVTGWLCNGDQGNYVYTNYTGHSYDVILGVYFADARFYDPANRTWLAQDPAKDGRNWYQYCGSNPITRWDPTGLMSHDMLNLVAKAYRMGLIPKDELYQMVVMINALHLVLDIPTDDLTSESDITDAWNPILANILLGDHEGLTITTQAAYLSSHETAQILASGEIANSSIFSSSGIDLIELESKVHSPDPFERIHGEVDIRAGNEAWEVKPFGTSARRYDRQLGKYNKMDSALIPGRPITSTNAYAFSIEDKPVYINVVSEGSGRIGYFFTLSCGKRVENTQVVPALQEELARKYAYLRARESLLSRQPQPISIPMPIPMPEEKWGKILVYGTAVVTVAVLLVLFPEAAAELAPLLE